MKYTQHWLWENWGKDFETFPDFVRFLPWIKWTRNQSIANLSRVLFYATLFFVIELRFANSVWSDFYKIIILYIDIKQSLIIIKQTFFRIFKHLRKLNHYIITYYCLITNTKNVLILFVCWNHEFGITTE